MKINTNIRNMTNESHIIDCERFCESELFVHALLIFCCVSFTLTRRNPWHLNLICFLLIILVQWLWKLLCYQPTPFLIMCQWDETCFVSQWITLFHLPKKLIHYWLPKDYANTSYLSGINCCNSKTILSIPYQNLLSVSKSRKRNTKLIGINLRQSVSPLSFHHINDEIVWTIKVFVRSILLY